MFCPKCGKEIKDNAKFCNFCGETIKKNSVEVNAVTENTQVSPVITAAQSIVEKPKSTKANRLETKVSTLESVAQKRMVIFAVIALLCVLLVNGWSIISQHQTIQNYIGIADDSNFFELRANGYPYINNYGRLFVESGKAIVVSLFFFIVCLAAKKCPPIMTGIPAIVSSSVAIVWNIVITMASKMGLVHNIAPNYLLVSIITLLPEIVFIVVYLLSVKGKIHISLLAKTLTVLTGCIPVVLSFVSLIDYFMRIDVALTSALGTTYIALSLVASVLSFLAGLFVKMAMFVYVFNTRKKVTENNEVTL